MEWSDNEFEHLCVHGTTIEQEQRTTTVYAAFASFDNGFCELNGKQLHKASVCCRGVQATNVPWHKQKRWTKQMCDCLIKLQVGRIISMQTPFASLPM